MKVNEDRNEQRIPGTWALVITGRKQTEEAIRRERDRAQQYLDLVPVIMVALDADGGVTLLNRKGCEVLGCSLEQALGKNWFDNFVPRPARDAVRVLFRSLVTGKREAASFEYYENPILARGGEERLIAWHNTLLKDDKGGIVGTLSAGNDITERKRMEEELRHYSEHLQEMVRERTEKLQDAERLATVGEIAAMVGHDLRNPLTGIATATHLLKMRLDPTGDYAAKEAVRIIERSIEYSNKIIGDLMEYSGEMRLQPTVTDPRFLTRAATSLVTIPGNIRILDETRSEPQMTVHVERIVRVFTNLIRNAVEAMPQGGTLRISSRRTDAMVEFDFADTGSGMTAETMGKLWTPLFTTKARGMGFGLAVSKRIIEAHGGSVSAESIFGKGSTFRVKLPIRPDLRGVKKT